MNGMSIQKSIMRVSPLNKLFDFPLHPILLALFSIVSLWLTNQEQVPAEATLRSFLISIFISLTATVLFAFLFRSSWKTGLSSFVFLIWFFSFGHLFQALDGFLFFGVAIGRYRYLWGFSIILFAGTLIPIWRSRKNYHNLNRSMNLVAVFLLVIVSGQLTVNYLRYPKLTDTLATTSQMSEDSGEKMDSEKPDVYYIILDSYARSDWLYSTYGYENSYFLSELEKSGFIIPECTQSNYSVTLLSMASSLNMVYTDELPGNPAPGEDPSAYKRYFKDNQVSINFHDLGYKVITFKTSFPVLNLSYSDQYYDPEDQISSLDTLES
jgi:hypothetical protein